jgi:hypothetical protein
LQRGEVEYSLRAIPLGGYVAFPDDDTKSSYASDDPDLLQNRNVAQRAVVISAGVVANVLFALAILFAQVCCSESWVARWESAHMRTTVTIRQQQHVHCDTTSNNICSLRAVHNVSIPAEHVFSVHVVYCAVHTLPATSVDPLYLSLLFSSCDVSVILQMNIVGKAQTSYLPGLLVPDIS